MASIERIKRTYAPRVKKFLQSVAEQAHSRGLVSDPVEEDALEDYSWSVFLRSPNQPKTDGVDVKVTMAESEHWDGTEDGLNFMLDVDTRHEKLGGMIPYNYSDEVWVPRNDAAGIEQRWREFVNAVDEGYIADQAVEHFNKLAKRRGNPAQVKMPFADRRRAGQRRR